MWISPLSFPVMPIATLYRQDNHLKAPYSLSFQTPYSLGLGQVNNLREITQHCHFQRLMLVYVCNKTRLMHLRRSLYLLKYTITSFQLCTTLHNMILIKFFKHQLAFSKSIT